jgi:hypothetical protein
VKSKIRSPKFKQAPNSDSNGLLMGQFSGLGFDDWNLFGVWELGFGI